MIMKPIILHLFIVVFLFGSCDGIDENEFPEIISSNAEILEFLVDSTYALAVDSSENSISDVLPPIVDIEKVIPYIDVSRGATIIPESGVMQDFSKPVVYTVTARDGLTNSEYYVALEVSGIIQFSVGDSVIPVDYVNNAISKEFLTPGMPINDITQVQPEITVTDGSTITPQSGQMVDFSNPVKYTVTSKNGINTEYLVTIRTEEVLLVMDRFTDFTEDWTISNTGEDWNSSGSPLVFTSKGWGWDQRAVKNGVELAGDFNIELKARITERMSDFWPRLGFFIGGTLTGGEMPRYLFALDANDIAGTARYDIISISYFQHDWIHTNMVLSDFDVRNWTIVRLEKRGDELKTFVNGVLVSLDYTNSEDNVSGNLGLFGENANGEFEYISIEFL
jgi:hypothetical protein